jgi:hypothetical protein
VTEQGLKGSGSTGISPKMGCFKKALGAQFAAKTAQIMCCEGDASPMVKEEKGSAHQPLQMIDI